jgi:hypothetical protein
MTAVSTDAVAETAERGRSRLPGTGLFLRRLWWALVGIVVGVAVGLVAGQSRPAVYESTGYVTVSVAPGGIADATAVARAAQGLARLAAAPSIVSGPLRAAGFTDAADRPETAVTVSAAPDAPVISVTGTGSSAVEAQQIALTVSRTLAGLHPFSSFVATVVATPQLPTSPMTPTWTVPAAGLFAGLAVSVVLAASVPPLRRRRSPVS